jgi:hypothetical protein
MGWRSPNEQWYVVEKEEVTDTGGSSVLGLKNLNPQIQKLEVYHAHDKVRISEPMGFKYWSGRQCHGENKP